MNLPYELSLGWRYTRAGRATRRNGFISFISGVSMLGIALGVAALIIVLSVMNGFQKEVLNIDVIVPALEQLLGASFLPRDVYLISRMPSDPQQADILPIAIISLVLAFVATLYPSWRASRVNPAEALRYE